MSCKGCGEDKKLVRSHVIPEAFFRGLRDGDTAPRMLTNITGKYPKKAPIGVYDQTILCADCENVFQLYDDYGSTVLLKDEEKHEKLMKGDFLAGYKVQGIDYSRIKLFFMSILWRASVSSHEFYRNVRLGKLEGRLKELVWAQDPGGEHEFSFGLAKFDDGREGRTILDPHQERFFTIRYYRFYLFGYVLYIKADSRATPERFRLSDANNDTLYIVSRGEMANAKEFRVVQSIASK